METVAMRKQRIRWNALDQLDVLDACFILQLEVDLNKAKTHADLDAIEDAMNPARTVADEDNLFGRKEQP